MNEIRGNSGERRRRARRLTDVHLPRSSREEILPPLKRRSRVRDLRDRVRRRSMVRAVRHAMAAGELELHYQPQVDIQLGEPTGVEALLRWRRRGELVPPGQFLPVLERSELMGPLTEYVLERAVVQAAEWWRAGTRIRVAVNLSAANLLDFRVVDHIETLLDREGLDPEALVLEVTETTVLEHPERTRAVLEAITELGPSVSVDDFGLGYSSLLWLQIFPVTEVKVDRSFVAEMHGDGRAFVEGVVRLARDLSLRTVAEGIEEEETLRELQALGCDCGQGWLFAPAMPADELDGWLEEAAAADWARREKTISIDPDFEQIPRARDVVAAEAADAGLGESEVWDMKVAVTEALANAIEHGACASDNLIHVRITSEQGEFRLDIVGGGRSGGEPKPRRASERGRGISIMSGTTDSLKMTHERDQNLIQLAKSLNGNRAPAAN